jgi:hypothetical protein
MKRRSPQAEHLSPTAGARVRLGSLLAPFLLAGCSTLQTYSVTSPTASFAAYRTYAHGSPETTPTGFARTPLTPAVWAMVQVDLDQELARKGYTAATGGAEPDLLVRSGSGSRTLERNESAMVHGDAAWIDAQILSTNTQATLVIDVFDARTHALVWHGSSRRALDAPAPTTNRDAPVAEAVRAMLVDLPTAAGAPHAP